MRILLVLLAALFAASCGATSSQPPGQSSVSNDIASGAALLHRYGLTIAAPAGWDAAITCGAVRFANRELPGWPGARELEAGDLVIELLESDPAPEERSFFPRRSGPPLLRPDDFAAPGPGTYPEEHGTANIPFSLVGRFFVLFAESGARPAEPAAVEAANRVLATLTVEPGDFYPGEILPARFEPVAGWHVGSSGPQQVRPDGDWATAWAATIPYLDVWNELPMQDTLEALPRDGSLIWMELSRLWDPARPNQRFPARPLPYSIADFEIRPAWERQVRDIPEYLLLARVPGQYEVTVRVYFGRADPTSEMQARAQAQLGRLRLPDWGPWELQ